MLESKMQYTGALQGCSWHASEKRKDSSAFNHQIEQIMLILKKSWLLILLAVFLHACSDKELESIQPSLDEESSTQTTQATIKFKKSGPVKVTNRANVVIKNLIIDGAKGIAIDIRGSRNIKVQNCIIKNATGEGVYILSSRNVEVSNCYFENVRSGVYAVSSQTIKVQFNECKNVRGPMPRGQMVQFDKVSGEGNLINYNYALNVLNQSNPEDVINLYLSSGTAASPIQVIGNYIKGGGPSRSGGGIMCGDGGDRSGHIIVRNNVLINPGQYGIAVISGRNITATKNRVYSKRFDWSNVGMYSWRQNAKFYENITMSYNDVNWTSKSGQSNHGWAAPDVRSIIKGWNTNYFGSRKATATMARPANCGINTWAGPLTKPVK
jgi:parallel beta-helix repeat protein